MKSGKVRARIGCKIVDVDIEVNEQHGSIRIENLYFTAKNAKLLMMVLKAGVSHLETYEKYHTEDTSNENQTKSANIGH